MLCNSSITKDESSKIPFSESPSKSWIIQQKLNHPESMQKCSHEKLKETQQNSLRRSLAFTTPTSKFERTKKENLKLSNRRIKSELKNT